MYSSNHSVRHCSILNLHIIITQIVLPNQSKHMDMILRELWGYYAELPAQTRTHAHIPKVKQMPNTNIFSTRDNQSLMRQVIPPGWWPSPHPSGCRRFMHQHGTHARTRARAHTRTCQLYSNMPAVPYKGARQLHIVSGLHSVSEFASTGSGGQRGFSRKFVKP